MKAAEALKIGASRLNSCGIEQGDVDAGLLLSTILQRDRLSLMLDRDRELSDTEEQLFFERIERRAQREPLQYIEGETEFMGFPFLVSEDVLIPRQDTEILVETAVRLLPAGGKVFDLGTGSGAIAVSLARLRKDAQVTAGDISSAALDIARQNARKNHTMVEFVLGDCLEPVGNLRYDMIVSNPPYISEQERTMLSPEVLREPSGALFDGGDGLSFYRRITAEAPMHLSPGGILLFEIGWQQADAVSAMLEQHIGEPFRIRDYGGNWRVLGAKKTKIEGNYAG